mmetsp:Transcript_49447/g.142198  ORF Transcript_49447/g.142198 Transcript_49447/m.142198 type:complete len:361 (-) Transcript_49447:1449-2531(-)
MASPATGRLRQGVAGHSGGERQPDVGRFKRARAAVDGVGPGERAPASWQGGEVGGDECGRLGGPRRFWCIGLVEFRHYWSAEGRGVQSQQYPPRVQHFHHVVQARQREQVIAHDAMHLGAHGVAVARAPSRWSRGRLGKARRAARPRLHRQVDAALEDNRLQSYTVFSRPPPRRDGPPGSALIAARGFGRRYAAHGDGAALRRGLSRSSSAQHVRRKRDGLLYLDRHIGADFRECAGRAPSAELSGRVDGQQDERHHGVRAGGRDLLRWNVAALLRGQRGGGEQIPGGQPTRHALLDGRSRHVGALRLGDRRALGPPGAGQWHPHRARGDRARRAFHGGCVRRGGGRMPYGGGEIVLPRG